MRLLVSSHACVVDTNQILYSDLAEMDEFDVTLVAPRKWASDLGVHKFRALPEFQGRVILGPAGSDQAIPTYLNRRAGSIAREVKPDLILVEEEPGSLGTFRWSRVSSAPLVFFSNENRLRPLNDAQSLMRQAVFQRAIGAVVLTPDSAEVLRRQGFEGPVEVIAYGVDDRPIPPAILPIRHPIIGYIGRIWHGKGVHDLWNALSQLAQAGFDWGLLWVGDGPDRPQLTRQIADSPWSDRVHWAGAVPHREVNAFLARCDLLVVPSRTTPGWTEQLSRALQAALVFGIPVVASDSGSNAWQIEATGGGLVFPEGDVASLTRCLEKLLLNPQLRQRLGCNGAKKAGQLYSRGLVARRWRDFLCSLPV